jgi:hypothetical protein
MTSPLLKTRAMRGPRGLQLLAAGVLAAAVISAVTAFAVVSASPTGLSPISDATSEWGLGAYTWCFRWFEVALAVAGVTAIGLAQAPTRRRLITVQVALGCFTFGRALVGWVPMDAPGAPTTTRGLVHWGLGTLSFGSVIVIGFVGALSFVGTRHGHRFAVLSRVCGALAALGLLVDAASTRVSALDQVFGLFERMIYLGAGLWFTALVVGTVARLLAPAPTRAIPRVLEGAER